MAHMDAGENLDLERQDGRQLRLGEFADIGDGKFGVLAGLRIKLGQRGLPFGISDFERVEVRLIEPGGIVPHRPVAMGTDIGDDLADQGLDRGVVAHGGALGRLEIGDAGEGG